MYFIPHQLRGDLKQTSQSSKEGIASDVDISMIERYNMLITYEEENKLEQENG